jgi:hypothetical protein
MIRQIEKNDYLNFAIFCSTKFNDFYITKNNQRLSLEHIEVNKQVFNACTKHGDVAFILEEKQEIQGSLLVLGYADKFDRKYIKLASKNLIIARDLLRYFVWNHKSECYLKIKKDNPILSLINNRMFSYTPTKNWGFKFVSNRGTELLFHYIPNQLPVSTYIKDEDND